MNKITATLALIGLLSINHFIVSVYKNSLMKKRLRGEIRSNDDGNPVLRIIMFPFEFVDFFYHSIFNYFDLKKDSMTCELAEEAQENIGHLCSHKTSPYFKETMIDSAKRKLTKIIVIHNVNHSMKDYS